MLRFACPTCAAVIQVPEMLAGKKGSCPKCGQRLQVPVPIKKTVLGKLLPNEGMPTPSSLDRLKDTLGLGIASKLLTYLHARQIYIELGKHAGPLNQNGIGMFCGPIQNHCVLVMFLALCKIFDRRPGGRTLHEAMRLVEKEGSAFSFLDPFTPRSMLIQSGHHPKTEEHGDLLAAILGYGKMLLRNSELIEILRAMEEQRNERLVHHAEFVEPRLSTLLTWSQIGKVADVATCLLEILSTAFFAKSYFVKGECLFEKDAERVGHNIRRLLKRARIAPNTNRTPIIA
jgi:hypothetical protein